MKDGRTPTRRWPAWLLLAAAATSAQAEVQVTIEGIGGQLADNVRKFLSINETFETPPEERQVRRLHAAARGEIEAALQPFGYYQPAIDASLTRDGEDWTARYRIDHGPATEIRPLVLELRGEGAAEPGLRAVLERSGLKAGERLVHGDYKATKGALLQAAYDAGYLDAAYTTAEIRVHPAERRAGVRLILDTGPRYYFGDITIEQNILSDRFLRRYLTFEPGDPFDTDQLTELQLALSDTDYFSQVEIEAERDRLVTEAEGAAEPLPRLPVVIRGTPRKPQKYTASVGYGTDTGPRLGLGLELRRLNRRGHKFRADLRVSAIEQAASARYTIPIDDVRQDRLTFAATVRQVEIGDTTSDSYALSAARENGWVFGRRRLYLNLERENFEFGGVRRSSNLFYPGVTLSFQRADNALRTRRGVSLSADVHGGSEALISSTTFLQATLSGKAVLPLGPRGRLLVRGEAGATETDDFAELPPTQRFFTGGARSVRGYDYQEISPENAQGEDIGGQYLVAASVEAEYLFYGNFGAAVFFDAGDTALDPGALQLKRGVGIGARWLSPVGTVRLDFAHPLDDTSTDVRIHFSLGPDL